MASQRFKLAANANNSKNTRMDIAGAGIMANWRTDELAHISRYCKIAEHIMDEAARLKRPVDLLEIGCGQIWTLRYLYKAIVCKKEDQVRSYTGIDIDPSVKNDFWSEQLVEDSSWFKIFNGRLVIQDLTVKPAPPASPARDGLYDFFYTTEVIEHMQAKFIEPWLKRVAALLRPGGLAYVSTPNHDGSRDKLPKDHVYEWGFEELKALLTKYFELVRVDGVFTQLPAFGKAFKDKKQVQYSWGAYAQPDVVNLIRARFDPHWQRVILAMFYPEVANNCAWTLRKRK